MSPEDFTNHVLSGMAEGRAFSLQERARELAAKDAEIGMLRQRIAELEQKLKERSA